MRYCWWQTVQCYLWVRRTSTQTLPVKEDSVNAWFNGETKQQSIVVDNAVPHVIQLSRYPYTQTHTVLYITSNDITCQ